MLVGVCCAMNQNRSMSIHKRLLDLAIPVRSYGVSDVIRLPSTTSTAFNTYSYGTTYAAMIEDLSAKNRAFYTESGILGMLHRNASIKDAPEYFFSSYTKDIDVVISCDTRCFDLIFERFGGRGCAGAPCCILLGFEINDTLQEAQAQAQDIAELVRVVRDAVDGDTPLRYAVERGMRFYMDRRGTGVLCAIISLE